MEANELTTRIVDVGGGRWGEPAHQLAHRGLDLAPEQQPAVAGQRLADAVGELADDPEVDVADGVVRQHEDVGGVQVGVEVAEHEDLVEHVPVEVAADAVEVVAGRRQRLEVRTVAVALGDHHLDQGDALDQLRRQHPRGRVVAVHAGDALELVVPGVLVEQGGLAGLDEVVELVCRPARELVDDLAALDAAEHPAQVEQPGDRVHEVDVGLEDLADVRALDLDRDPVAVVEDRPMDLADRRRGERLPLEGDEDLVRLAAEFRQHDAPDLLVAERRDLVEQPEQLVAVRDREQVVAQREHLAELHPRPAQLLERDPHPDRAGSLVRPREVECRGDEQPEEDGQDVPDPSGVPEEVPHAAALGPAADPIVQSDASSNGTRRRRLGIAVSSSHSRPALTSSAKKCLDHVYMRLNPPSTASWPSRP